MQLGVATLTMIRQGVRHWIGLNIWDMKYGARRQGPAISRSGKARRSRSGRPGTARAPTSRCSPPTRPRSRSACSTAPARRRSTRIELPEYTNEICHGYLPEVGPAPSTATASTAPTSRTPGTASIRTSCCSIPMRAPMPASSNWDPAVFGYTIGVDGRPHLRRAGQRALHAEMRRRRSQFRLARRAQPPVRALGPHHPLRDPCQRLHQAPSEGAGDAARHLCRARRR